MATLKEEYLALKPALRQQLRVDKVPPHMRTARAIREAEGLSASVAKVMIRALLDAKKWRRQKYMIMLPSGRQSLWHYGPVKP